MRKFAWILIPLVCVVGGLAAGWLVPRIWMRAGDEIGAGSQQPPADEAHDHEHVDLTSAAQQNLGLKVAVVQTTDVFRTLRVPGVVVEMPGHSNHTVAATVNGIVTRVHVVPGQALKPGDPVCELRLSGEALATAQADLLETLQLLEGVDAQLARINPLAAEGGVAGKEKLRLDIERKRLLNQRSLRAQELLVRGLEPQHVDDILTEGRLLRELTVRVPAPHEARLAQSSDDSAAAEVDSPGLRPPATTPDPATDDWVYTLETLNVFPGKAVRPGDELCHLAYHTQLFVEGRAFENEVDAITRLSKLGWKARVEFGHESGDVVRDGFDVLYVDNHVDAESQTFRFFLVLHNEVLQDSSDEKGTVYRTWRFKPGQRVHVSLPVERYQKQFQLPRSAVVHEGPNVYVFRRTKGHGHAHAGEDDAHAHEDVDEFVPVPVTILHEDPRIAVVSADGDLKSGHVIAMNQAYQLLLTLRAESSPAAGHGHPHPH